MDLMGTDEERIPLSPRLPNDVRFTKPKTYGSGTPKHYPTYLDNPLHDSFKESSDQKFAQPIISRETTSEDAYKKTRPDRRTKRLWNTIHDLAENWWLGEILLWFVSATCLFSMVAILGVHDGKAIQSTSSISLNTVVAILSTLSRYALGVPIEACLGQLKWTWFRSRTPRKLIDIERFDKASRGPWGSALLVWNMRGRSVASLGATIIVLSLALDPFFQQLVSYPQRRGVFGIVGPSRTTTFQTIGGFNRDPAGYMSVSSDLEVEHAIELAIAGDTSSLINDPICTSSNCYWPPFQTLALCSECRDITNLLERGCLTESGDWTLLQNGSDTTAAIGTAGNTSAIGTSCGYFINATSSNPVLMSGYRLNSSTTPATLGEALWMRLLPLTMRRLNTTMWDGSYHFKNLSSSYPVHDMIISISADLDGVYNYTPPMAAECVMRYCVQTITAKSEGDGYKETILSTYTNDTSVPIPFDGFTEGGERYELILHPPDQNETFIMPYLSKVQTAATLDYMLPSTMTSWNQSAYLQSKESTFYHNEELSAFWKWYNQDLVLGINEKVGSHAFSLSSWPKPKSVAEYHERLASAISRVMRRYPNSTIPVEGYGTVETYVHIRWLWLILPVALVIGTFVLLLTTILKSHHDAGGIWKTSVLATLFHGLEEDTRVQLGNDRELSRMQDKANVVRVVFTEKVPRLRIYEGVPGQEKGKVEVGMG